MHSWTTRADDNPFSSFESHWKQNLIWYVFYHYNKSSRFLYASLNSDLMEKGRILYGTWISFDSNRRSSCTRRRMIRINQPFSSLIMFPTSWNGRERCIALTSSQPLGWSVNDFLMMFGVVPWARNDLQRYGGGRLDHLILVANVFVRTWRTSADYIGRGRWCISSVVVVIMAVFVFVVWQVEPPVGTYFFGHDYLLIFMIDPCARWIHWLCVEKQSFHDCRLFVCLFSSSLVAAFWLFDFVSTRSIFLSVLVFAF